MDLFGKKVDIQIETVILFFLIGISIVLLLYCFEPWKSWSTARAPTVSVSNTVPTIMDDTNPDQPTVSAGPVVEPFQQVTADSRILYKKIGFNALGIDGKDAKVNILRFKTRPIKDSETDFQVAYMFTQDMETLKSLNKGEPVTLLDSSTTKTQPIGPITPPDTILKNTLYKIFGLPADYVTYAIELIDKVLVNYTNNKSDDKAKLAAVQKLIKDEFNKLPANGQEWQKRLKNVVDKISAELPELPATMYPDQYLIYNMPVNLYREANAIRVSVAAMIEVIVYTASYQAPFNLTPVSGIGSLLKYMYSYDTINNIINNSIGKLYTKITSYSASGSQLITQTQLTDSKKEFISELNTKFNSNTILTTANKTEITDAIYDSSIKSFTEGKFSEDITPTTTQPAAPTGETDPKVIQVLQAIGSKYYDPATGDRKTRDRDFYLEFSNGLEINVKFLFNYVTNMTGEVKCDATITELPPGSAADPAYKTYKFDTCQIEYINQRMVITFTRTTGPVNYAKVAGGQYTDVIVIQTFKLEINLGDTPISESADTFQSLIDRAVFFNTFMSYGLSAKLGDSVAVVKPVYTINLFPQSITSAFESLKEYTKSALNKTTERLLKDNVAEIVTPMFMVDQRLDRTEGILAKIKDHYRFNELSNAQSGYRFYPVSE
jgi:hypothetical protein